FKRLFTQGMVTLGGKAMSKSRGNVVGIDVVCDKYGADTGRLFTLFASPPDREMEWTEEGVEGIYRFLGRLWRLFDGRWELDAVDYDPDALDDELKALHRKRHSVVKKFTEDIERIHFNTAIAQAMELVNDIYGYEAHGEVVPLAQPVVAACLRDLVDALAPFAPFICEELNERLGENESVHDRPWPSWDEDALEADFLVYPIQVNGKIRDQLRIAASATEDEIRDAALGMDNVSRYTEGRQVKFFKVVPGKLVTIAVK
ncbi:MAG: class I tRNA ligase family protein, partial [Candidatus Coatesbacteria bacterium]|nr:class I tRNA ligase family protein [Candidatus Coatesbacteria bacterium]